MARLDKLTRQFKACNGPFDFRDFERMIELLGYKKISAGRTGGSRRKYHNDISGHLIMLDEPHDGEMGFGMVRRLRSELEERGAL